MADILGIILTLILLTQTTVEITTTVYQQHDAAITLQLMEEIQLLGTKVKYQEEILTLQQGTGKIFRYQCAVVI